MNQTPKTTPFSISRFITSTLAYFVIFAGIIGMFYLSDPTMLAYNFLFVASGIAAVILGVYHAKYKKQKDIDAAVDADVAHIEEEIEEEIDELKEKLHRK